MISKRIGALFVALSLFLLCSCGAPPSADTGDESMQVVVTFDALYEIAAAVCGDGVTIIKIIPDGVEAHDFEPKPKDLTALSSADILIVGGLGMEPWAERAVSAAGNEGLTVVDVSSGFEPISLSADEHDEHSDHDHDDHDHDEHDHANDEHDHGEYDPHAWLSLKCAAAMARSVRDALTTADPAGADEYAQNCDAFTAQLDALYDEYSVKLGATSNKTIVTSHAVLAYLCRDFGLTQNSVSGVFAEGEPSAKQLAELVDFCRENGITTILAESLASPQISETLAKNAGATVKTIYTIEGAEDGMSYIERMSANLAVIYDSLK